MNKIVSTINKLKTNPDVFRDHIVDSLDERLKTSLRLKTMKLASTIHASESPLTFNAFNK